MEFTRLYELLHTSAIPLEFVFTVLDTDGATSVIDKLSSYDITVGGNGGGFWYRSGDVVEVTSLQSTTAVRIEEIITELRT